MQESVVPFQNGDDDTFYSNSGNGDRKECTCVGYTLEKEITGLSVIYTREMKDRE